jgi:hypothetical protein
MLGQILRTVAENIGWLNCNNKYDYQLMRLAEVYLFLLFKSVARREFPLF